MRALARRSDEESRTLIVRVCINTHELSRMRSSPVTVGTDLLRFRPMASTKERFVPTGVSGSSNWRRRWPGGRSGGRQRQIDPIISAVMQSQHFWAAFDRRDVFLGSSQRDEANAASADAAPAVAMTSRALFPPESAEMKRSGESAWRRGGLPTRGE